MLCVASLTAFTSCMRAAENTNKMKVIVRNMSTQQAQGAAFTCLIKEQKAAYNIGKVRGRMRKVSIFITACEWQKNQH